VKKQPHQAVVVVQRNIPARKGFRRRLQNRCTAKGVERDRGKSASDAN
jgi:hypothetical protein